MRKIYDFFEEVQMDIETEEKCIQDIGHTFMTPHRISDKDFSEEIKENLSRFAAIQFPISSNILIHYTDKFNIELENDWKPFSRERKDKLQQFHDSLVHNQLTKNKFAHAWKQTYEYINDFCNTFYTLYKLCNKFYIQVEFPSLYIHDTLPKGYNEQVIKMTQAYQDTHYFSEKMSQYP